MMLMTKALYLRMKRERERTNELPTLTVSFVSIVRSMYSPLYQSFRCYFEKKDEERALQHSRPSVSRIR